MRRKVLGFLGTIPMAVAVSLLAQLLGLDETGLWALGIFFITIYLGFILPWAFSELGALEDKGYWALVLALALFTAIGFVLGIKVLGLQIMETILLINGVTLMASLIFRVLMRRRAGLKGL